ncbi:MAG: acyl carrier protein [Candidatus Binataceae bacterium]
MTDDEIKALVLRELGNIAPEIDPNQIDPGVDLREQIDLDSINVLDVMIAVHEATGVDIPEADYPKLLTLNDFATYLGPRIANK